MNFKGLVILIACFLPITSLSKESASKNKIQALSTIPDLAWLIQEIGGDKVNSQALLTGRENPHHVDAIPEFVLRVADADLVCMVGMELEIGYLPPVLSRSGNAKVQAGSGLYCDASRQVPVLEKPSAPVNRSMGDVHPHGNPHYYLSPTAMSAAASEITSLLSKVKPEHAKQFLTASELLKNKLLAIAQSNKEQLKSIDRSKPLIIEYHKEFSYFFNEYELNSFGSIEEKPGVPPSAHRIGEIALAAKKAGVKIALATDYSPTKVLKRFSEISGIPFIQVPTMIQPGSKFDSYEKVQTYIAEALKAALSSPSKTET